MCVVIYVCGSGCGLMVSMMVCMCVVIYIRGSGCEGVSGI